MIINEDAVLDAAKRYRMLIVSRDHIQTGIALDKDELNFILNELADAEYELLEAGNDGFPTIVLDAAKRYRMLIVSKDNCNVEIATGRDDLNCILKELVNAKNELLEVAGAGNV